LGVEKVGGARNRTSQQTQKGVKLLRGGKKGSKIRQSVRGEGKQLVRKKGD